MSTLHDNMLISNKLEKAIHDLIREHNLPAMAIKLTVNDYKRHSVHDVPCTEHEFNAILESQNNTGEFKIECTQLQDFKSTYLL